MPPGIYPRPPFADRFWAKVKKTSTCWLWTGQAMDEGYGVIRTGRKSGVELAHRLAWMLLRGDPGNLCVLHKCDTPACVRPSHLFLGTRQDNSRDMVKKDRQCRGERNGQARLTKMEVLEIRKLFPSLSQIKIAKQFGISRSAVQLILLRRRWKHV